MLYRLPIEEELSLEIIAKFAKQHLSDVTEIYEPLLAAYLTQYPIFDADEKPAYKPDNRLAVNFAKFITDTMQGFFMGVPVKISSTDEKINAYLDEVNGYNDVDDVNAEEFKLAAIFGRGYELEYIDDYGEPGFTKVSPLTSLMIYDDSVLQRKRAFVRLYKKTDDTVTGSVSDNVKVRYFQLKPELKWLPDADGNIEGKEHGFNGVPAVEFYLNEERQSLYGPILNLINAYNKALSEKANDVDALADAYLKILGVKLDEDELKNIRDNRIINFSGSDTEKLVVDFLNRQSGDETQEHLLDRLNEAIFKVAMVPDISDENFATQSGIAIKYKMQPMSNLAKSIERKFKAAFQERYRLIFSNPVNSMAEDNYIKVDYVFTLNYPANLLEESQIASNLSGITSRETQLKTLSIVDNVKEELDRIEEEADPVEYETDFPTNRTIVEEEDV